MLNSALMTQRLLASSTLLHAGPIHKKKQAITFSSWLHSLTRPLTFKPNGYINRVIPLAAVIHENAMEFFMDTFHSSILLRRNLFILIHCSHILGRSHKFLLRVNFLELLCWGEKTFEIYDVTWWWERKKWCKVVRIKNAHFATFFFLLKNLNRFFKPLYTKNKIFMPKFCL